MKWFDQIGSVNDARYIIAGGCICRHSDSHHRAGVCDIYDCAVECSPPHPDLVEEAKQYLKTKGV